MMVMVGDGFTSTGTVDAPIQPDAEVPLTVYTTDDNGEALTVGPLVVLSPAAGDHVYDCAPAAVSETDPPAQIVAEEGVTTIVGCARGKIMRHELLL